MSHQNRLVDEKDEFVESLNLTPEKIREDLEKMRDIEGFPIGDVEDILELSDPPYYTAYPNPYIKDFIEMYGTPYDEETDDYDVEPFVGDVSEGKNDPIYRAHTYHTKVPPKAIVKFIEHYTKPGDVIFDGFCGSGMAGIAAQMTRRKSIIADLSPAATFISNNYNHTTNYDLKKTSLELKNVIKKIETDWGWMYNTKHSKDAINTRSGEKGGFRERIMGKINYVIWSDVLICPFCSTEFVFWKAAVDKNTEKVINEFKCINCASFLKKNNCKKAKINIHDKITNDEISVIKTVPALIDYNVGKHRFRKKPDNNDFEILKKIYNIDIPYWVPVNQLPDGDNTKQPKNSHGIEYTHQFYTKRALIIHSALKSLLTNKFSNFLETSILTMRCTNRMPYRPGGRSAGTVNNLYIPSLIQEYNVIDTFDRKGKQILKAFANQQYDNHCMISTGSITNCKTIPSNYIDYIFTDPPFGANINYSEISFLWESWLKVFTNIEKEAIINRSQGKSKEEYKKLMIEGFHEMYRILKPGRWITIEFHNSKAEIWKIIQDSITKAGFIIAQVAVLDKKQGSWKQVNSPGSVKNDLVINAYKPLKSFSESFLKKSGLNMEKDFIKMHLKKLPIEPNVERTQQMLYSKLIARYIQNGFEVRMDASDFYELLKKYFEERDGYWLNQDQLTEYEQKLKLIEKIAGEDLTQTILGISDEKTAIIWLAQFLQVPKTYDEIFIEFSKNLLTSEDKMPELRTILEENFATEAGKYRVPSKLERKEKADVRDKRLIKEFNLIFDEVRSKRKIKEVRKEALLHGLMKLYQDKDEERIRLLGEKLDQKIIDSDDDISAIIDWAKYR